VRRPNRELPDYLKRGLDVVFVGFNPGERSAHIGHYYAGRGNQFWNFLYESGLVPERLRPEQDRRVLEFGLGLTDLVKRWSRSANELRAEDFNNGAPRLERRLRHSRGLREIFRRRSAARLATPTRRGSPRIRSALHKRAKRKSYSPG